MTKNANQHRALLEERIREKISDYSYYNFTPQQTCALNIFFDLAQEYEDIHYLYRLPVDVLQFFFGVEAELYARDDSGELSAQTPKVGSSVELPAASALAVAPCAVGPWWFFAIKGRPGNDKSPASHRDEREALAVLAILPNEPITEHEKLFYQKFANRLGFSLHNRLLGLKRREHIEFVRTLVHDIGHNVIVPNLHFKLLMRQMAGKITTLRHVCDGLVAPQEADIASLRGLCDHIEAHYEEISKHFHQSSFFLETLLRQSHFDQGKYVLQRTDFDLVMRVVAPQLDRYRLRFEERDIAVEEAYATDSAHFCVNADAGLLSQVVANFFSNAVKYTRATPGGSGLCVRCSVRKVPGYFDNGQDGILLEVLSTGSHIPVEEAKLLFTESFRASNVCDESGTGHGLYFSYLIINQHSGECGYRWEEAGNIFYMALPALSE